jgi:hypothetical protein
MINNRNTRNTPVSANTTVINTGKACQDITNRFNEITKMIRDNTKGTALYEYQVEMAYLLDKITRGPIYIAPKHIGTAYRRLSEIDQEIKNGDFQNRKAA